MELRQVWSFLDCWACAKNLRVALTVEAAPNNLHHQGHKRTFNTLAYYKHSPPDWNWGMTDSKCSNDLKNCGLAGLEDLRWPHSFGWWSWARILTNIFKSVWALFHYQFNSVFLFPSSSFSKMLLPHLLTLTVYTKLVEIWSTKSNRVSEIHAYSELKVESRICS